MARDICIDGVFLAPRYFGSGINRYFVNLLRQMGKMLGNSEGFRACVLLPSSADIAKSGLSRGNGFELVSCSRMRFRKLWKRGLFAYTAKELGADAVFQPAPGPTYLKTTRLAMTIHDIIPLLLPNDFPTWGGLVMRRHYASSVRRADLILTDSECAKADMVSTCRVPADRIVVAHLGFDSDLFKPRREHLPNGWEIKERYGIDRPYILHVGALGARKNLMRLVRAYRLLMDRRKDFSLQLVLCGREQCDCEDLYLLIRESGLLGKVVLTGSVPDYDLAVLYQQAACCAMPSLYEGFGLPVLEAMASGCSVISSDRSSLPEIAGDAALYFNPESEEEMAVTMEKLLDDSTLRQQLVERGIERARQFSWESCARTTLAAFKSL